jgi:hypothetical protein|tara:strand:- start:446 stop:667 length:222 start_codon:yes stop_codon:yes gene_type:complete
MNIINNDKISIGFDILDEAMNNMVNKHKLNFYEVLTVLAMMDTKVKQNNISQYLMETVTRFQENINKEDEKLR